MESPTLVVGIDWSNSKHQVCFFSDGTTKNFQIAGSAAAHQELIDQLLKTAVEKPIEICVEKSRVSLVYRLSLEPRVTLYLVDPKQAARYRESFASSGAKADSTDAWYLAKMLQERKDQLRVFRANDKNTRKIEQLCRLRRRLVDNRTKVVQQLTCQLKMYFPLVFDLIPAGLKSPTIRDLVRRWPDPRKLKKTHPGTLRKFFASHRITNEKKVTALIDKIKNTKVLLDSALIEPSAILAKTMVGQINIINKGIEQLEADLQSSMNDHPDAPLFRALPGAGAAMAPRLMVAFGNDRQRYTNAQQVACYSGIAPVTKQSGKTKWVHHRYVCPKFLKQTFQEFAQHAKTWCPWSKAFYKLQRDKGMGHQAAVRKLAYKWIRILFRVWKDKVPYDQKKYILSLNRPGNPLKNLAAALE